ncbi:MAG: hypothetical protein AAGH87_11315 [Pseudomonadota bacterium]
MAAITLRLPGFELGEKWQSILSRTHRTLLALIGSYFLTNGFIAMIAAGLPRVGVPPGEAAYLGLMTGLVLFVGAAVWVAATRYLGRITAAIIGLALMFHFSAPLLAPAGV